MRDVDRRDAELLLDAPDLGAQRHAQLGVEVRERLVEEEDARLDGHGARQGNALLLPARELRRSPRAEAVEARPARASVGPRRAVQPPDRRRSRSPYATFSKTVRCGNRAYDWKTMPISRLSGVRARDVLCRPPGSGRRLAFSKPAIIRSVVVFPQPDGPSSVTNAPPANDSETSSTATTPRPSGERNSFVSRSSSTLAGVDALPVMSIAPRQRRRIRDRQSLGPRGRADDPVQERDRGAHDDDQDDAVGEGVAEARGVRLVEDLLGHDPRRRGRQEDDRADRGHRPREGVDQPGQEGGPDQRQHHPPERRRLVGARGETDASSIVGSICCSADGARAQAAGRRAHDEDQHDGNRPAKQPRSAGQLGKDGEPADLDRCVEGEQVADPEHRAGHGHAEHRRRSRARPSPGTGRGRPGTRSRRRADRRSGWRSRPAAPCRTRPRGRSRTGRTRSSRGSACCRRRPAS